MSLTLAANDRTTHPINTSLHFITVWSYIWAWTLNDQRFTNLQQTQNPFIYQNYSRSEIIKNLARTLSLFLIFSENYYKSKTRIYVTELCYDRWFTTQNNDKVLIEQTKKQGTYSLCRSKAHCVVSAYISY